MPAALAADLARTIILAQDGRLNEEFTDTMGQVVVTAYAVRRLTGPDPTARIAAAALRPVHNALHTLAEKVRAALHRKGTRRDQVAQRLTRWLVGWLRRAARELVGSLGLMPYMRLLARGVHHSLLSHIFSAWETGAQEAAGTSAARLLTRCLLTAGPPAAGAPYDSSCGSRAA